MAFDSRDSYPHHLRAAVLAALFIMYTFVSISDGAVPRLSDVVGTRSRKLPRRTTTLSCCVEACTQNIVLRRAYECAAKRGF